jgi:hypothetical protein
MAVCAAASLLLAWPEARVALGIRVPAKIDQTNKLYGGRELAAAVDLARAALRREAPARVAVGAATYDSTSRLAFYLPDRPHACNLFLGTRMNSYGLWERLGCPMQGENAIIVDDYGPGDPLRPPFEKLFLAVRWPDPPVEVFRRGVYAEPIHTYYLYRCYGYRPNPAVERTSGG